MGYTHYWSFNKAPKGQAARAEKTYLKAIKECAKIALEYNRLCKELEQDENRLSGYTAHTRVGEYGGLQINGKGGLSHESFDMREHYNQACEEGSFCKTARKPYDLVVVACLCVLKHRLGELMNVSSDGYKTDWVDGAAFASKCLGIEIGVPESIVPNKRIYAA